MAGAPYRAQGIVLRKTKLGEADLIVTVLAQDGSEIRAIAHGARKPRSAFSSRLELCAQVELLCARGRSLDIIQEVRLVAGNESLRASIERAAVANLVAEVVARTIHGGLAAPRLFDMTAQALARINAAEVSRVLPIAAACGLKTVSLAGLRPSLERCVACGEPVALAHREGGHVRFSYADGGVVCAQCAHALPSEQARARDLALTLFLITSTFARVEAAALDSEDVLAQVSFLERWSRVHLSASLKSVGFLLSCGLF